MRDSRRRLHSEMSSSNGVVVRAGLSLWLCSLHEFWGTLWIRTCLQESHCGWVCCLVCAQAQEGEGQEEPRRSIRLHSGDR